MIWENSNMDSRLDIAPNHWDENFKIYHLTEKMRSKDEEFSKISDKVRKGICDKEVVSYMESHVRSCPSEENNEQYAKGKLCIIVQTNKERDRINQEKLLTLLPNEKAYLVSSNDQSTNVKNAPRTFETLPLTQTGQLENQLIFKKHCPVQVSTNHPQLRYKNNGIVNGVRGYVDSIQVSKDNPDEPEIIWVRFNDDNVGSLLREDNRALLKFHKPNDPLAVPIRKQKKQFQMKGNINWLREQFPLTVCYAVTAHKSQGQTLEEVLIDFSAKSTRNTPGAFYTAMSRVRFGKDLYLRDFKPEYISSNMWVEYKLNAMKISQPYTFKKILLDAQIFEHSENELKIGYININSLLTGQSCSFLNRDENLLNLDVLVVADTRLQQDTNEEQLRDKLSNWKILKRFDSYDEMKHMGLLLLGSRKSQKVHLICGVWKKYWEKVKGKTNMVFAQLLVIQLTDKKEFGFMYVRETPTLKDIERFVKDTKDLDILTGEMLEYIFFIISTAFLLTGDLNLDPERDDDMKKLTVLLANNKVRALKEVTTTRHNQLDHILVKKDIYKEYYCSTFLNFTSDHRVVTMRLPIEDNRFSDSFKKNVFFEQDHWTKPKMSTRKDDYKNQTTFSVIPENFESNIDDYLELLSLQSSRKIILHMPDLSQLSTTYFEALPSNFKDIKLMKTADVYLLIKWTQTFHLLHWTSESLTVFIIGSSEDTSSKVVLDFIKEEYIDQLYLSFSASCPRLKLNVKKTLGELHMGPSSENVVHILSLLKHEVFGVSFDAEKFDLNKQTEDIFRELGSRKVFPLSKKRKQQPVKSSSDLPSKKSKPSFRTFSNSDMETCWLNSCMQLMLALLDHSDQTAMTARSELLRMLFSLKSDGVKTLNPLPVRNLLMKTERQRIISDNVRPINRLFHYYETTTTDVKRLEKLSEASRIGQQDCLDFFVCLNENKKQWQDIVSLFEISTFQKTVCQSCGGVQRGESSEKHSFISLDCPAQNISLKHLVNLQINEGKMIEDWRHEDGCGERTTGKHSRVIQNIENVQFLMFVVPRLHNAGRRLKIDKTKIEVDSEVEIKSSTESFVKFKAISIIHHKGYITGNDTRGHYLADVLDVETNQWIRLVL